MPPPPIRFSASPPRGRPATYASGSLGDSYSSGNYQSSNIHHHNTYNSSTNNNSISATTFGGASVGGNSFYRGTKQQQHTLRGDYGNSNSSGGGGVEFYDSLSIGSGVHQNNSVHIYSDSRTSPSRREGSRSAPPPVSASVYNRASSPNRAPGRAPSPGAGQQSVTAMPPPRSRPQSPSSPSNRVVGRGQQSASPPRGRPTANHSNTWNMASQHQQHHRYDGAMLASGSAMARTRDPSPQSPTNGRVKVSMPPPANSGPTSPNARPLGGVEFGHSSSSRYSSAQRQRSPAPMDRPPPLAVGVGSGSDSVHRQGRSPATQLYDQQQQQSLLLGSSGSAPPMPLPPSHTPRRTPSSAMGTRTTSGNRPLSPQTRAAAAGPATPRSNGGRPSGATALPPSTHVLSSSSRGAHANADASHHNAAAGAAKMMPMMVADRVAYLKERAQRDEEAKAHATMRGQTWSVNPAITQRQHEGEDEGGAASRTQSMMSNSSKRDKYAEAVHSGKADGEEGTAPAPVARLGSVQETNRIMAEWERLGPNAPSWEEKERILRALWNRNGGGGGTAPAESMPKEHANPPAATTTAGAINSTASGMTAFRNSPIRIPQRAQEAAASRRASVLVLAEQQQQQKAASAYEYEALKRVGSASVGVPAHIPDHFVAVSGGGASRLDAHRPNDINVQRSSEPSLTNSMVGGMNVQRGPQHQPTAIGAELRVPANTPASGPTPQTPANTPACGPTPPTPANTPACGPQPSTPHNTPAAGVTPANTPALSAATANTTAFPPPTPVNTPAWGVEPPTPANTPACGPTPPTPANTPAWGVVPPTPASTPAWGAQPQTPNNTPAVGVTPANTPVAGYLQPQSTAAVARDNSSRSVPITPANTPTTLQPLRRGSVAAEFQQEPMTPANTPVSLQQQGGAQWQQQQHGAAKQQQQQRQRQLAPEYQYSQASVISQWCEGVQQPPPTPPATPANMMMIHHQHQQQQATHSNPLQRGGGEPPSNHHEMSASTSAITFEFSKPPTPTSQLQQKLEDLNARQQQRGSMPQPQPLPPSAHTLVTAHQQQQQQHQQYPQHHQTAIKVTGPSSNASYDAVALAASGREPSPSTDMVGLPPPPPFKGGLAAAAAKATLSTASTAVYPTNMNNTPPPPITTATNSKQQQPQPQQIYLQVPSALNSRGTPLETASVFTEEDDSPLQYNASGTYSASGGGGGGTLHRIDSNNTHRPPFGSSNKLLAGGGGAGARSYSQNNMTSVSSARGGGGASQHQNIRTSSSSPPYQQQQRRGGVRRSHISKATLAAVHAMGNAYARTLQTRYLAKWWRYATAAANSNAKAIGGRKASGGAAARGASVNRYQQQQQPTSTVIADTVALLDGCVGTPPRLASPPPAATSTADDRQNSNNARREGSVAMLTVGEAGTPVRVEVPPPRPTHTTYADAPYSAHEYLARRAAGLSGVVGAAPTANSNRASVNNSPLPMPAPYAAPSSGGGHSGAPIFNNKTAQAFTGFAPGAMTASSAHAAHTNAANVNAGGGLGYISAAGGAMPNSVETVTALAAMRAQAAADRFEEGMMRGPAAAAHAHTDADGTSSSAAAMRVSGGGSLEERYARLVRPLAEAPMPQPTTMYHPAASAPITSPPSHHQHSNSGYYNRNAAAAAQTAAVEEDASGAKVITTYSTVSPPRSPFESEAAARDLAMAMRNKARAQVQLHMSNRKVSESAARQRSSSPPAPTPLVTVASTSTTTNGTRGSGGAMMMGRVPSSPRMVGFSTSASNGNNSGDDHRGGATSLTAAPSMYRDPVMRYGDTPSSAAHHHVMAEPSPIALLRGAAGGSMLNDSQHYMYQSVHRPASARPQQYTAL